VSSFESFLRNIFVKKEVRLSLLLGSTTFGFFELSSGLSSLAPTDDRGVTGLFDELCVAGVWGADSIVFPSSSEPVSVECGGLGMAGMGMSEAGVWATGDVGAEVSASSIEPILTPPKLLAVVRLKSSDFVCLSCVPKEFSERDAAKCESVEFEEVRCESIECDVAKCGSIPTSGCVGRLRVGWVV
jgi:hypothetical protein